MNKRLVEVLGVLTKTGSELHIQKWLFNLMHTDNQITSRLNDTRAYSGAFKDRRNLRPHVTRMVKIHFPFRTVEVVWWKMKEQKLIIYSSKRSLMADCLQPTLHGFPNQRLRYVRIATSSLKKEKKVVDEL